MTGILELDEGENEILLEGISISIKLAMKNKKNQEGQDIWHTIPGEHYHLLYVFKKETR